MQSILRRSFLVGGAVRDRLLGHESVDRDWVVVGVTEQAMLDAGFSRVGADFPVFLHPASHEQYALARAERKTRPGYHGFVVHADPSVSLDDDLLRRDLTINAMAIAADGHVVDPYGGQRDLAARQLRHVSPAFAEDPVRILRVARFAARFADFSVAEETMALMRRMVDDGEVDALVSERVWQELARGLMEDKPSRLFEVLRGCGALARLLPEVDRLWGVPQPAQHHPEIDTGVHLMLVLDCAAALGASLGVRFACLCHDLGKGTTAAQELPRHIGHEARSVKLLRRICTRLRVSVQLRELAEVVALEHGHIHASGGLNSAATLRLLERCDALRRPARFAEVLLACECDARGRQGLAQRDYPPRERLPQALQAALSVDTEAIAKQCAQQRLSGQAIGAAIRQLRVRAIAAQRGNAVEAMASSTSRRRSLPK